MSIRGLSSWQTALADLSLILFAVVAASYRDDAGASEAEEVDQSVELALGQPMGVFRPGGDADLSRWLTTQSMGEGEVATVVVRHLPGEAAKATTAAAKLVAEIESTGRQARLMVEPADYSETLVVIAHDRHALLDAKDGTVIAVTR